MRDFAKEFLDRGGLKFRTRNKTKNSLLRTGSIVRNISIRTGYSRSVVREVLRIFVEEVVYSLAQGINVSINGLGCFFITSVFAVTKTKNTCFRARFHFNKPTKTFIYDTLEGRDPKDRFASFRESMKDVDDDPGGEEEK